MSEMRANQSGSESVIKPRQNSCVNTDESSSSAVCVPKDDLTSGSGNLTPRLEPEMSWDPFSPAPIFPVGFFSGLVDTIEKLDEETEEEVLQANRSSPDSLVTKSKTPDTSGREENVSHGDDEASFGDTLHVEPLVSLTRKSDLTTGEENEDVVFKERAKLYRLHEGQWKERGLGDIKILVDRTSSKARILMRREKVLKICANHLLTDDMVLNKKSESPNTYVWYTPADVSDTDPVPEKFAVRFKTEETGKEFSKAFTAYKSAGSSEEERVRKIQQSEEREEKKQEQYGKDGEKEQKALGGAVSIDFTKLSHKPEKETIKFDTANAPFNLGSDGGEQKDEKQREANGSNVEKQSNVVQLDFKSPGKSAGFVFDPSKFKFNFGTQKTEEVKDSAQSFSVGRNPFLDTVQSHSASKTSILFGKSEDANNVGSPPSYGPPSTQASTPFASNMFQRPNFAFAESTPNSETFVSPATDANLGQQLQGQDDQVNDYLNATSQGPSFTNVQMPDQARYFQSDWESAQDRYYDAIYDENGRYYDENSFYQNDDYQNDGEYYTAEDIYYGDEDAYYENSEQGFEYYDQDPPQDVPPADSDANSDRLSQAEGPSSSEEHVPHVVQMIDDDIFVTYFKKASFAQRAKASRLQLPPNFYASSSYPPCPGCRGCGVEERNPLQAKFGSPHSEVLSGQDSSKREQKHAVFGATAITESAENSAGQKFFSFADLLKSQSQGGFTNQAKSKVFSGAGSLLFTAKEEQNESDFDPTFKPIVELKKKEDLKTGEEGYENLFKNRAKLFRFDFNTKQWKERGVGDMKLSYNPDTSYCRVIMRRDQVLKLCANHPVMPDIELKPHGMSSTSWLWVSGADYSEGEPQMQQFAVKFKTKEIADEFKRVFQDCQRRIVKYLDGLSPNKSDNIGTSAGKQLASASILSPSRHDTLEDDLVITYMKEPSIFEENKASLLMLPRTFFALPSVSPCPGCIGCRIILREQASDVTDGKAILTKQAVEKEEKKSFLSFSDLASSTTDNPTAFQSTGKGFSGAGTTLFTSPKQDDDPNAFDPTFKPIVKLKKKEDLKTGEEGYENLFKNRAKLFRFDFNAKQWKERGVGDMKLSYNPDTSYCRVIMRRDQVLKLCANHPVMPDIELKPHGMSSTSWLWVSGADYSEGEPQMQQFVVKFKTKEIADEFKRVFQQCQQLIKTYLKANNLPLTQLPTGNEDAKFGHRKMSEEEIKCINEKKSENDKKQEKETISEENIESGFEGKAQPESSKFDHDEKLKKSSPWTCSSCYSTNSFDSSICSSCNTARPVATSLEKPAAGGLFSVATFNFGSTTGMSPFGSIKFEVKGEDNKEISTVSDQEQLKAQAKGDSKEKEAGFCIHKERSIENIPNSETCVGRDAQKSSVGTKDETEQKKHLNNKSKAFGIFKIKEGSWECQTCMVRNDKDKDKCISCGAENLVGKPAASKSTTTVQESSTSKSFGIFKIKEGSWECQTCMVQNDKDKDKCIACASDNPKANPSLPTVPFTGQNSSGFVLGSQASISFQSNADSAPLPKPAFSMPLFRLGAATNQKADVSTQEGKASSVPKDVASFAMPNNKSEELAGGTSLFATQFGASNQQKGGIFGNFWSPVVGPFTFGDSGSDSKITQDNQRGEKAQSFEPVNITADTPKVDTVSGFGDQTLTAHPITPRTPESPSKEEGGGILCSPVVSLERLANPKTGEEDEVVVFCDKAKMYRYDAIGKEWKERGVGELKILQKRGVVNKYRLIMRRDQIRKLCANHFLVPGMTLNSMPSSEKMKIWTTTADYADEETKKETFAVRFKTMEILEAFELAFKKATAIEIHEEQHDAEENSSKDKIDHETEDKCIKNEGGNRVTRGDASSVEDIDVKDIEVTEVLLPSSEDQNKAEKLLLPKEFFNKPNIDIGVESDIAVDVKFK